MPREWRNAILRLNALFLLPMETKMNEVFGLPISRGEGRNHYPTSPVNDLVPDLFLAPLLEIKRGLSLQNPLPGECHLSK